MLIYQQRRGARCLVPRQGAGIAEAIQPGIPHKTKRPRLIESWDVCRSALPQVLLNQKTKSKPLIGKWLARAITLHESNWLRVTQAREDGPKCLFYRDRIKFAGRFFIEQRALFRIAAAPVFVSSWNPQEIAWPYALLTGIVLVQISPFH